MRTGMFGAGFRVLGALAVVALPATAFAHIVATNPVPRDVGVAGNDAHKAAPCGAVPRTTMCTSYASGATIPVTWTATVEHNGCFQIALSQANDQGFTILKQIQDPSGSAMTMFADTVTLPAGVTCKDCTLVVRQLVVGQPCSDAPFQNDLDASTYYSCADIRIGDPSVCGASQADAGGDAGSDSGGPHTEPTDGGGKLFDAGGGSSGSATSTPSGGDGGGGCSVALGATSGVSLGVAGGLLALALVRRRRRG